MSHWDDIKKMAFEDRIAQMALAILYSSNHIDVTLPLVLTVDDEAIRKEAETGVKKAKFANWKKAFGDKPATVDTVKLTQSDQGVVDKLVKEARTKQDIDGFESVIKEWIKQAGTALEKPPYRAPDIGIIFRQYQDEIGPKSTVSEVNYDTVAVTIIGDTIYMACNYKVRRMPTASKLTGFDYSNFDQISSNSRGLILTALKQDLIDDKKSGEFSSRASGLKHVIFVGLAANPKNEQESAAPHAEMQLVSFLTENGLALEKQYVGVNKACCGKCYDALHQTKMTCAEPRGSDFKNWLPPSQIKTQLVEKRSIAE